MKVAPVAVVVLTRDEEANIARCLEHVVGWADEVVVLDSGSIDRTAAIAREAGATVVEHTFAGFVEQRNWALRELPVRNEWVLFVDADEYPTEELKEEVGQIINNKQPTTNAEEVTPPASPYHKGRLGGVMRGIEVNLQDEHAPTSPINGYYLKRRFMWDGRWIRHGGYYPVWILRLMRRSVARCEGQLMDEHFAVDGATGKLEHDLVHDDRRGLADWKAKHRRYAVLKAKEYWQRRGVTPPASPYDKGRSIPLTSLAHTVGLGPILPLTDTVGLGPIPPLAHKVGLGPLPPLTDKGGLGGVTAAVGADTEQRLRAGRRGAYDRLPLFLRAVLYFGYVFILRGGFLDGPTGWRYHVLHGLWYPLLIDREIVRLRRGAPLLE
ncbi:MAG: glycosyltransferase family 2 protein [bacterium]|nr:glycosyltransferase family 2 protein [bacterium]